MAPTRTPALNRKFGLLIEHGYFNNKADIAAVFNRSVKALEAWGTGQSGIRNPDLMPSEHLDTFYDIIAKCFPQDTPRSYIEEIAHADWQLFKAALLDQKTVTLATLLASEGKTGGFRMFALPEGAQVGLVESNLEERRSPDFTVKLSQWFRLELPTRTAGYHCTVLQKGGGLWGTVPHAHSENSRQLCMPGFKSDGQPGFIRERHAAGRHRFVVIQTSQPMPVIIHQSLREKAALNSQTLRLIAGFLKEQRRAQKSLSYVDIEVLDK